MDVDKLYKNDKFTKLSTHLNPSNSLDKYIPNSNLENESINNIQNKISKLNRQGLARIVIILLEFCPDAIVDLDQERWMIKTELIDREAYSNIYQYLIF